MLYSVAFQIDTGSTEKKLWLTQTKLRLMEEKLQLTKERATRNETLANQRGSQLALLQAKLAEQTATGKFILY